MPFPDALKTNPKVVFFTDFDGTITLQDSNDCMTDNLGMGFEERRRLNIEVLEDRMTFADSFRTMLDSVKTPFPECIEYLKQHIQLDPTFRDFFHWAKANNVPVVVLSSGMTPIIRGLLVHLIGPEANELEIVSNEVVGRPGMKIDQEGGWTIKYHDNSGFGHDKSLAIRPYKEHIATLPESQRATLLYAGDGVSDLSAAKETDLLFAKAGRDLVDYCRRENIPFTTFEDWTTILATVQDLVAGKTTAKQVASEGWEKSKADNSTNKEGFLKN
ncbi:MAG: hypothetical protein M1834_007104 [Cirrosporium novae-zelandiae]|nr:MAG: hypothetical protein M1834_007104 [Cirrosporium novae-zelandiae]